MPESAEVGSIEFENYEGPVKGIEKFRLYFTTLQLERMIEVGISMIRSRVRRLRS